MKSRARLNSLILYLKVIRAFAFLHVDHLNLNSLCVCGLVLINTS